MTSFLPKLVAAWMGLSSTVFAQSPVVVELFTSQGCSSCPPADALFRELATREDVIALSMHVDYWDYIGWKDEFADPQHAKRQRAYAVEAGRRSIYTPQMIVNGVTDIVGTKPMELSKAISAYQRKPSLSVSLERSDGAIFVSTEPSAEFEGPFVVYMAQFQPLRKARITRGENAGHTLNYANVVENMVVLGEWDGQTPFRMEANAATDRGVVVWLQQGVAGPIRGASLLR